MTRPGSARAGHREPGGRLLGLAETLESHRGFAEVVASVRSGHGGSIGGTWGSASALAVAALAGSGPGTLVVILPHAAEAEAFVDDLALFSQTTATLLPPLEAFDAESDGGGPDPAEPVRLAVVKQLALAASGIATSGSVTQPRQARRAGSPPAGGGPPSDAQQDAGPSREASTEPARLVVTSIQAMLAPLADPRDVEAGTRRPGILLPVAWRASARWS